MCRLSGNYTRTSTAARACLRCGRAFPTPSGPGVESLSGLSLDDVKVNSDSSKPAQLQASAYAQGPDIHLAPGQEKHLPHETWHVVQQKQGRVRPTGQLQSIGVNDDASLEREADVMGARALLTPVNADIPATTSVQSPVTASTPSVSRTSPNGLFKTSCRWFWRSCREWTSPTTSS